jgi:hypothetical protein
MDIASFSKAQAHLAQISIPKSAWKEEAIPTIGEWFEWKRQVSKILRDLLAASEKETRVETEEEPIVAMARYMYNVAAPNGPEYDQLPLSRQFHWQKIAAQAWEIYWAARERRENR